VAFAQEESLGLNSQWTLSYNKLSANHESAYAIKLNMEVFVSKSISLNYSLGLGSSSHDFYYNSHAGLVGGGYLFLKGVDHENRIDDEESSINPMYFVGIFLALIPEGINFYVPVNLNSKSAFLVPYINPLSYTFYKDVSTMSSGAGMKLQYFLGNSLYIMPDLGVQYLYKTGTPIMNIGLGFGLRF
jgi:hypothetical protein